MTDALIEFTCNGWGCLATWSYESDEAAFDDGWRGARVYFPWNTGKCGEMRITHHTCPECSPKVYA